MRFFDSGLEWLRNHPIGTFSVVAFGCGALCGWLARAATHKIRRVASMTMRKRQFYHTKDMCISSDASSFAQGKSTAQSPNSPWNSAALPTATASSGPRQPDEFPKHPIWRIAITGGPCSGKSTCMKSLRTKLMGAGFRVLTVPEVATMLFEGGHQFGDMTTAKRVAQQRVILQTIMVLEDGFYELARLADVPAVVLCDRGTMDGRAYCSDDEWAAILTYGNYTVEELRDARYDAVIHLVTAAMGAEQHYNNANNAARRETVEEARAIDEITRSKWMGHRRIAVIDNSTDFEQKVQRVIDYIMNLVQEKKPKRNQRFFSVGSMPAKIPVECTVFTTTSYCLVPRSPYSSEKLVVRRGEDASAAMYFHIAVDASSKDVKSVRITHADFVALLQERGNVNHPTTQKRHTAFFVRAKYFTLTENQIVLAAPTDTQLSDLPPFLKVGPEIRPQDD